MKPKVKVYLAGPYSTGGIGKWIGNIRRGIIMGRKLISRGFIPFIPWLDFMIGLVGGEMAVEEYKDYSMEWLKACDCVYLLNGWEESQGAKDEVIEAKRLGKPVFHPGEFLFMCSYFYDQLEQEEVDGLSDTV